MSRPPKLVSIGNYKLSSTKLGKGTFAKVELAEHVILKKQVALKVVVKSQIRDPYLRKHLNREASILGRLSHPNIVKLIEICKSSDVHCLVLEYVPDGTLFDRLKEVEFLTERESRQICRQLISAIAYLHKMRILHRDLKLENIMLDGERVVLVDFGLSNNWYPGKVMLTHCGSAEYASPELFQKNAIYGPGVDVWSFGIILYALNLGHLPFQLGTDSEADSNSLASLIKKISLGLGSGHYRAMNKLSIDCRVLILKCLDTNPNTRISITKIRTDPWISHAGGVDLVSEVTPYAVELKIAQGVKDAVGLKHEPEHVLRYVKQNKYKTTAGCFNLLKLYHCHKNNVATGESLVPEVKEVAEDPGANGTVINKTNAPSDALKKDEPGEPDAQHVRTVDSTETSKKVQRLLSSVLTLNESHNSQETQADCTKSVQPVSKPDEEAKTEPTNAERPRQLSQRAFHDISNAVRPPLNRDCKKEPSKSREMATRGTSASASARAKVTLPAEPNLLQHMRNRRLRPRPIRKADTTGLAKKPIR